jgi:microcystin-dependent protein
MGEIVGEESVTLISNEMPQHNHLVNASNGDATDGSPTNNVPAVIPAGGYTATPNTTMNPQMAGFAGGSQPHDNIPPLLVINFCIALSGIFPSRN